MKREALFKNLTDRLLEVPDPFFETQLLLSHVYQCQRIELWNDPLPPLSQAQKLLLEDLIVRRQSKEPLAYLLGYVPFWNFEKLIVNPSVLIPRAETELLISVVLEKTLEKYQRVLELGTGSGAIALALHTQRTEWDIFAVDKSLKALETCQKNLTLYGINDRLKIYYSDWFSDCTPFFDVIVSNPPYIDKDGGAWDLDIRYEPASALFSGKKGLEDLYLIIQTAPYYLRMGGLLALEHGFDQKDSIQFSMKQSGFKKIQTYLDLNSLPRVTIGFWEHG